MKILDRYVLVTFIKNYLISLLALLGLYIVLDMVFSFDELAEVQQRSQLVGSVKDVTQNGDAVRATLTLRHDDTAAPKTEFKISGPDGHYIGTLTVDSANGHDVSGPVKLGSSGELPHKTCTATAPGAIASNWDVTMAILNYYYHHSFLFFVQLSGIIPVVAAAFTLIRMSRFNELTAILAAGVPLLRVALPIVYAGVVINFVLLPIAQELVIPTMIPELTKKADEIQQVNAKTFPIRAMQDDGDNLLNSGKYTPPDQGKPGHLDVVDIIERNADHAVVGHITADSADYDPQHGQWALVNGQRVTGLGADEKRSPQQPVATWKTSISPEEIALYRSGDFVELLATEKINQLLQRPKSYGTIALLRVKHFRWSQLLVNIVLLLLAIPCVMTREPGTLKTDLIKCIFLCGVCMAGTFLAHQIAGNPPAGEQWRQQWPLIMAWIPIFIFLPLAIFLLDQKHAKKT
jgi:lipopolysaccharide export LptBFGC system permease protein LptF